MHHSTFINKNQGALSYNFCNSRSYANVEDWVFIRIKVKWKFECSTNSSTRTPGSNCGSNYR